MTEDLIEELLRAPDKLTQSELEWVKRIDKTTSKFNSLQFTTKQKEVIESIYEKYKSR